MRNPQLVKDLQALYDLFSKPGTWGQGAYYGNGFDFGRIIHWQDVKPEEATCFCFVGGMRRITGYDDLDNKSLKEIGDASYRIQAICTAVSSIVGDSVIEWNDRVHRTENDILVVIQQAKDAEEAKTD